jgi:YbbR domain-containing protein
VPSGVVVSNIKAEPKEVTVIVSTAVPADKIAITTEEINLTTISDSTTLYPKLIIPPELKLSADKIPEVKVIIEVEKPGDGSSQPN